MEERLKEFESHRKSVCKKANILLTFGILLPIVGFLLIMYFQEPVFILMMIAGFVMIGINSSMKKKLSVLFKNEFTVKMITDIYPGAVYNSSVGISVDQFMEAGLFKHPDRWYLEDYLSASYDGVPFQMSDFNFQERHVTRDSKGHTRTTYVTYAKGRFMVFDFARDFNQVVKVVENAYLGLNARGLEQVETESIDFNKKFKVYASNGMTAFYVLTPQVQLKMLELESKFKGSIFFAYLRGKLYVAITDGVSILDINASKKVSMETIKILESQLMLPASIINELGLATAKFTSGEAI